MASGTQNSWYTPGLMHGSGKGKGCQTFMKIGELHRPSTLTSHTGMSNAIRTHMVVCEDVPPDHGPPKPKTTEENWFQKSLAPTPHVWTTGPAVVGSPTKDEADYVAKAWLSHPANKLQLTSLQAQFDTDGDGKTSKEEFRMLLKAAGSGSNADILFDQMDADGDGILTEAEIKALGQGRSGR